jgi:hypothetical protein
LLAAFRRACERGDSAGARRALQAWLRVHGPTAGASLLEFAARCDDEALRESICALDAEGYRPEDGPDDGPEDGPENGLHWSGRACWSHFQAWRTAWESSRREQQPAVTDLYAPQNRVT